ncbi:MAG: hypothetical protein ABL982_02035 [Vicinamibacterales bacterium]
MPTAEEVQDTVMREISRASGTPKARLKDTHKLRADLVIAHENFVVLAQNLRAFIKRSAPDNTLVLRDIDTASSTVEGVIKMVKERV